MKIYIIILWLYIPSVFMGQSSKGFLHNMHKERFGENILKPINQSTDSIYSFFEKVDITNLLIQEENISICNKPLFVEQLITLQDNRLESIIQSMHHLNCWEIGEKSFAEMSYAVLDTIIYDKPFTNWDTERISKLYMEKIKQKKRKERKKFNLTFIDCQEPLMDYSTNKFHKKISTSLLHLFLTVSIERL